MTINVPMNIVFTATKLSMSKTGPYVFEQLTFDIGKGAPVPSQLGQFSTLAQVEAAFADYVETARASGQSLQVSYYKHSDCRARKVRGFDAARKTAKINVNPAWEDGTPYVEDVPKASAA